LHNYLDNELSKVNQRATSNMTQFQQNFQSTNSTSTSVLGEPLSPNSEHDLPLELSTDNPLNPLFQSPPFAVNEELALRGYGYVPSSVKQRVKKEINEEMERFKKLRHRREQLVASEVVAKRVGVLSWKYKKIFIGETLTDDPVLKERVLDAELENPFACLVKHVYENPPKDNSTENVLVHFLKKKIYKRLFDMNKAREQAIVTQVDNEKYFRLQQHFDKYAPGGERPHKEFELGEDIDEHDFKSEIETGVLARHGRRQLAVVAPLWKVRVHVYDIPPMLFLKMKQVPWPVQTLADHLGELTQFMATMRSMEHFDSFDEEKNKYRLEDRG